MKKSLMILMAILMSALSAAAQRYVSRAVQPGTNDVATIVNTFADKAVPVIIYTDLADTTTNAVTVSYAPDLAATATDYGTSYVVGTFSTVGGAETPLVLNDSLDTNSVGSVILHRGDSLVLTGAGGTDNTNVLYRVLFNIE